MFADKLTGRRRSQGSSSRVQKTTPTQMLTDEQEGETQLEGFSVSVGEKLEEYHTFRGPEPLEVHHCNEYNQSGPIT